MAQSIITTAPTLNYVATSDISSVANGSTQFSILFDPTVATLGSVIMFEYKLQIASAIIPNLDNTSFGFVSVENAIQSGLSNQYIISVQAENTTNDGSFTNTIQVRVYTGQKSSSDVIVTQWSNSLNVYYPPATPTISFGYYDPLTYYQSNDMFIALKESENTFTDYDTIKFIVCYFYQDMTNNTVWNVSEPIVSTPFTYGSDNYRTIHVPNIGQVSTTTGRDVVYVSVHAVYDWTHNSEKFYSVSYVSNEIIALEGSVDNKPDITSVDYKVYVPQNNNPAVPGNQTIYVTWNAPLNSIVPIYYVNHYDLYYSLNSGTSFIKYNTIQIPSTTFNQSVNVGTTGLNLTCGDNILFRVNAVTVTSAQEPSDPSSPVNFFKYSSAPTSLFITNTSVNGNGKVNLTVNFSNVTDKGCGSALSYVVLINEYVYTGTGNLSYSAATSSYSISYSDLPITKVGTVKVYLQTLNTNAVPAYNMTGIYAETPYIAETLTLEPIVYDVYTYQENLYQNMNLNWSLPTSVGWTNTGYDVYLSEDSGTFSKVSINTNPATLTTFSYNVSSYATSVKNLAFKIVANMLHTATNVTYQITSNTLSKKTFKYATAATNSVVNWAVANSGNTTMDLNIQFKNPSDVGVNNGLQYFIVSVYNSSNAVIDSTQITYVSGSGLYTVNFNDKNYSSYGSVKIQSYVTDTNTSNIITSSNYVASVEYTADTLPFFTDIVKNGAGTTVSGKIISNTVLYPTGQVVYPGTSTMNNKTFSTTSSNTTGFSISHTLGPNSENIYTFTITLSSFFSPSSIPTYFGILASNTAGIGIGKA